MAKSVTTIPATLSRFTAAPINSTKKRRVAAYRTGDGQQAH